ncbi:MAG: putative toxin-antitoxin system toxin component, PIN family [Aromatoleum sp.]|jgi:putative PIN family toxin of toxin-antitoxin system|uniref:putative toxin-antitoxin system toxin component, PIN family n=1 Tax=Aromatoleum sp. TaxID=2307007 RepID=UPI002895E7F9|nr:putative toxin-antitoxin system toxin component, PIN family [Aromatoleum sp.]MDT3670493.1 putative toxin-antitoxin system toxin component, PIN family [Aromatoleum sp.]
MPDFPPPRLVLDTNTVMALWFFEDPRLARLRDAIEHHAPPLLARADTLEELRHVLAYRQFGASPDRQRDILDAYTARVTLAEPMDPTDGDDPLSVPALPTCRDRDDQKFLEVARDGRASHLLSRDKVLLKLHRHRLVRGLFAVVTPESFAATLESD